MSALTSMVNIITSTDNSLSFISRLLEILNKESDSELRNLLIDLARHLADYKHQSIRLNKQLKHLAKDNVGMRHDPIY